MKESENRKPLPLLRRKMTKQELADYLGVTVRTIDNYIRGRRLPFLKIGRSVRFDPHKVEEALNRFEIKEVR